MKIAHTALCLFALFVSPAGAAPLEDSQIQVVKEMGSLNGVALHCRYFEQVKRIKQILIDSLPKQRELGQVFEDETNASFLRFSKSGKPCPSPAEFAVHVAEAGEMLEQTFSVK
ncbi:MAG TPA: hypothetical protein EYP34_02075 [Chromatiaceae bacterium]|nr:hypothetical protein [Chromatiaceae bacterium]